MNALQQFQPDRPDVELPDPATCQRARLSRDPRFDGEFFLAVRTTGIYCRPICPARAPAEKNVRYFREAAQAAEAGFRPCLRCRPESAPGSAAWAGTESTVRRALRLIHAGALNNGSVGELAERLGVGERYLRKLFARELGISPLAVAQNRRLLFAIQLLVESDLSMTAIADAAGFGSLRRFNSAVRDSFGVAPSGLRRHRPGKRRDRIELKLQYRPPYDWDGVIDFFTRHAIEGVETVSAHSYHRTMTWSGRPATFAVTPVGGRPALLLTLDVQSTEDLLPLVARVRRMFDLDANPQMIATVLGQHPLLLPLLERFPGVRSPAHWSTSEAVVRSIVGQQVSVGAARTVCSRLAAVCASTEAPFPFPESAAIKQLDDSHFPMPMRRRESLRAACRTLSGDSQADVLEKLEALPGIGPWTLAMIAMRGLGDPDVFPRKDLGLIRAWDTLGGQESVDNIAAQWRPFRSYAANLLWRSL